MKIRTRIVILLAGIFIALETAHLSISTLLLQNSYDALEHKAETENNERIFRAFSGNINDLSSICLDWAEWDDMYNFITTRSPSFLRSSLNKDSLINNNLNAFYCIDLNGKVTWGMDYESGIEDGLQRKLISGKSISASHQFMRAITEGDLRGIYRFDKGDALIAAHPILRSDKTGSPKGIILMSRTINERMIQDIRGKTLNNFTIIKASDISTSGQPRSSKTSSEKTFFKNSGGRIYYYTPMRDISGQIVSYILRESKREISQSGQKTIRVVQMSLLAGGLAMMGIIILSLYRWVVTPLSNLLHQIKSIKTNGVFSNDLPVLHNDEIGSLTQEFNSLMHMTKHQTILLEEKNNLLEELARVDQLTKLYNRRHFDEALAREWKRSRREQKELSMLMIDIDLFKKFNDTYGEMNV